MVPLPLCDVSVACCGPVVVPPWFHRQIIVGTLNSNQPTNHRSLWPIRVIEHTVA